MTAGPAAAPDSGTATPGRAPLPDGAGSVPRRSRSDDEGGRAAALVEATGLREMESPEPPRITGEEDLGIVCRMVLLPPQTA